MKTSSLLSVEMVGALAVVLSLIFVGVEIRDGNREARAATTQAALDAEMALQATLAEHADVWHQVVLSGDMSDEVAVRRGIILFNMAMTLEDNRYQAGNAGYLQYSQGTVEQLIALPFFSTWPGSPGASGRSTDFLDFVDDLRDQKSSE